MPVPVAGHAPAESNDCWQDSLLSADPAPFARLADTSPSCVNASALNPLFIHSSLEFAGSAGILL